jgi:glycosyltransferase involved in cell wall biosynthesis
MASVVVLSFFPAFTPPASGGEMRLGQLYRAVARSHDVTILTSTDFGARLEHIAHTPRLQEIRFPKDELWRTAYATLERSGLKGELSGLAFALAVSDPGCELRQRARSLAENADIVIHEFPFSEPIFADGCPCREIYNSHNFEISLLSTVVWGEGFDDALLKVMRLEGNLLARAQRVFAVSDDDCEKFRLFYGVEAGKLGVCPNGIDDAELAPVLRSRKKRGAQVGQTPQLLFIGSAHQPNVEAGEFILNLAAELPECEFLVAGGVCKPLSARAAPRNVRLLGAIDSGTKAQLLTTADLFINPVMLGSGTSLKGLEAFGAGLPMVSTPEGVRGLGLTPGIHCDVVGRPEFAAAIRKLLLDDSRRQSLTTAAAVLVQKRYSWGRIAADFCSELAATADKKSRRKPLILELNDYPVLQAGSGGIARMRGLLTHLDCDAVLVTFGQTFEVALIAPGVVHVTVPKTASHQAFEHAVNEGQPMSVNDAVASLFVASNPVLNELVCGLAARAQAVVFEHPYMAPLLDAITVTRPELPVIYSAHNVEATHKREILRGHRLAPTLATFIAELEQYLVARARLIVCCTDADQAYFASAGVATVVVTNGSVMPEEVTPRRSRDSTHEVRRVGFIGSGHGPNVAAALFIARDLAPVMTNVQFELVGSVCTALRESLPKNMVLHGAVSEETKTAVMGAWDVALNPVLSGGGSSLKLPDYMAHGLPTLSTLRGARGFAVEEHDAGRVAELPRFGEVLRKMLTNQEALERQQANARQYAAEHLTWTATMQPYREALGPLLKSSAPKLTRGRLLVVTYRYTEPSLGGAEEYLIEILKRLRTRFSRLDLAAIDVDQLTNHNHFGCRASRAEGGASRRLAPLFDCARFFPQDEPSERDSLDRARNLERSWTREERALLAGFVSHLAGQGQLRLFGGFFWPENHNGVTRRWSSPEFSFLAPRGARAFRISGYAATEKTLRVTLSQVTVAGGSIVLSVYSQAIPPYFSVTLALPRTAHDGYLTLLCEVDEHVALGDHRPLGVLLESASVVLDVAGALGQASPEMAALQESHADLTDQYDEELRVTQFDPWVLALRHAAQTRDARMEGDFAAMRGPHSKALQDWLGEHAREYDVVLVQGIPFDVIPSSVETLAAMSPRPRIVTLPHFHGDDRFYHWQRYYQAFAAADATLLFSPSIAEHLRPVSTNLRVVPGGGVRSDEHGDHAAESGFRRLHTSATPFFLVLGRKTPSKGYDQVVRAHQALRRDGLDVDLILIGPDEDGRRIEGPGTYYLGRQPREVIRGALRTCLGLITMSRSESFGIVICEAWLFGKPVIANRACYAFRELVRDGHTGLLVTAETELAQAMRTLAEDAGIRDRLGRAGFADVVARFTWERVAEACFEVLMPEAQTVAAPRKKREVSPARELPLS